MSSSTTGVVTGEAEGGPTAGSDATNPSLPEKSAPTPKFLDVVALVESSFPPAEVTSKVRDTQALFALLTPKASDDERAKFIEFATRTGRQLLPGFIRAVEITTSAIPEFDFFSRLLPRLCDAVRRIPRLFPNRMISVLARGLAAKVTLSREQVFSLLAASFFQALPSVGQNGFGEIIWVDLMLRFSPVGSHRVACLLCYFHQFLFGTSTASGSSMGDRAGGELAQLIRTEASQLAALDPDDDKVIYERLLLGDSVPNVAQLYDIPVVPELPEKKCVGVSANTRIEDVASADAIVDFANKQVHIGCVIASATQEEVLFSIKPEALLAILLFEELADDEAGLVHRCQRYCRYRGYANSFQFQGPVEEIEVAPPTIVIIDAIINRGNLQFEPQAFERDLFKAYLGFKTLQQRRPKRFPAGTGVTAFASSATDAFEASVMPVVATGGWGCGIFRGDQTLKFLQQLIAAALARCRVIYCTFGNADLAKSFEAMAHRMCMRRTSIADVVGWVREFHEMQQQCGGAGHAADAPQPPQDFEYFVLSQLQ